MHPYIHPGGRGGGAGRSGGRKRSSQIGTETYMRIPSKTATAMDVDVGGAACLSRHTRAPLNPSQL